MHACIASGVLCMPENALAVYLREKFHPRDGGKQEKVRKGIALEAGKKRKEKKDHILSYPVASRLCVSRGRYHRMIVACFARHQEVEKRERKIVRKHLINCSPKSDPKRTLVLECGLLVWGLRDLQCIPRWAGSIVGVGDAGGVLPKLGSWQTSSIPQTPLRSLYSAPSGRGGSGFSSRRDEWELWLRFWVHYPCSRAEGHQECWNARVTSPGGLQVAKTHGPAVLPEQMG